MHVCEGVLLSGDALPEGEGLLPFTSSRTAAHRHYFFWPLESSIGGSKIFKIVCALEALRYGLGSSCKAPHFPREFVVSYRLSKYPLSFSNVRPVWSHGVLI